MEGSFLITNQTH